MSPSPMPGYIKDVVDLKLKVDALEAELDLTEERHAIQIESMQAEIDQLKKDNELLDRTVTAFLKVLNGGKDDGSHPK